MNALLDLSLHKPLEFVRSKAGEVFNSTTDLWRNVEEGKERGERREEGGNFFVFFFRREKEVNQQNKRRKKLGKRQTQTNLVIPMNVF